MAQPTRSHHPTKPYRPRPHRAARRARCHHRRSQGDRRPLGTSGGRAQLQLLESQREGLNRFASLRETWLEDNATVLHQYSAVAEELHHRIGARIAAYEMDPPKEVLTTLGPPPIDPNRRKQWTSAVARYAQARMSTYLGVDLADPAVLDASPWRHAANHYLSTAPQAIEPSSPVLRRAI